MSPNEIYDLETQLVYDKEPIHRRFIINKDSKHISEVLDKSLRKDYLGTPSTLEFMEKVSKFNNKFMELFDVPTVIISDFKEQLCGGTSEIQPYLVKQLLHLD